MSGKIYKAFASCVIVVFALMFVEPAALSASRAGHQYQNQRAIKRARRARAQKKSGRRAVSYVCPMHPDIREKARGSCPKCMMDLAPEPLKAKTSLGKNN